MTQLELQPQQPRCIDLDAAQSRLLTDACQGEFGKCFIVASRQTHPGDPQRWRMWIVPATASQVNKAIARLKQKTC